MLNESSSHNAVVQMDLSYSQMGLIYHRGCEFLEEQCMLGKWERTNTLKTPVCFNANSKIGYFSHLSEPTRLFSFQASGNLGRCFSLETRTCMSSKVGWFPTSAWKAIWYSGTDSPAEKRAERGGERSGIRSVLEKRLKSLSEFPHLGRGRCSAWTSPSRRGPARTCPPASEQTRSPAGSQRPPTPPEPCSGSFPPGRRGRKHTGWKITFRVPVTHIMQH